MRSAGGPAGSSQSLAGLRVLVTRPAHQADNLCRLIEERGGKALRLPMLEIVPAPHVAGLQRLLDSARDFDWWIFTSINAVEHARGLIHGIWPAHLAAIGPATAAALETGGCNVVVPQSAYSSEGLLDLPQFQALAGTSILLVTGEGGREALAPVLRARGAQVEVATVYRRVPLPYAAERVAELLRGCDAVTVTSSESLEHLLRLTPSEVHPALFRKKLVVPGPRMVEKANQLGFRILFTPEKMSDAGVVHVLEQVHTPKQAS